MYKISIEKRHRIEDFQEFYVARCYSEINLLDSAVGDTIIQALTLLNNNVEHIISHKDKEEVYILIEEAILTNV
jgi:hypothetical protein